MLLVSSSVLNVALIFHVSLSRFSHLVAQPFLAVLLGFSSVLNVALIFHVSSSRPPKRLYIILPLPSKLSAVGCKLFPNAPLSPYIFPIIAAANADVPNFVPPVINLSKSYVTFFC